jgi:hypothetical protein
MADETIDPNLDIIIDCADPQKLTEFQVGLTRFDGHPL